MIHSIALRDSTCHHIVDRLPLSVAARPSLAAHQRVRSGQSRRGLDETLTLHRLNVFAELGVSFKTTNLIESVMARLEAKTRRVTRWRTSDQKLRGCASALWAMERQFRRVKQYRHLPLLQRALQTTLSPTNSAAA